MGFFAFERVPTGLEKWVDSTGGLAQPLLAGGHNFWPRQGKMLECLWDFLHSSGFQELLGAYFGASGPGPGPPAETLRIHNKPPYEIASFLAPAARGPFRASGPGPGPPAETLRIHNKLPYEFASFLAPAARGTFRASGPGPGPPTETPRIHNRLPYEIALFLAPAARDPFLASGQGPGPPAETLRRRRLRSTAAPDVLLCLIFPLLHGGDKGNGNGPYLCAKGRGWAQLVCSFSLISLSVFISVPISVPLSLSL